MTEIGKWVGVLEEVKEGMKMRLKEGLVEN